MKKYQKKKCYLIKLSLKKKTNEEDEGENKKGESRRGGTPLPPHPLSLSRDIFQMRRDEGQCDKIKKKTYLC